MPEYRLKEASDAVAAEVRIQISETQELYIERDQVMHDIRRYRLMRHEPDLPRNWQKRLGKAGSPKVPLMYRLVQTAVTAKSKDFPLVTEQPFNIEDQPAADDQSRAMNFLLQSLDRQHRMQLITNFLFSLFGDGLAVFKTLEGRWDGYPFQDDNESDEDYNDRVEVFMKLHPEPFYVSRVNSETFYPPLDEYSEGPCVEIGWRDAHETWKTVERMMAGLGEDGDANRLIFPDGPSYPEREFPPSTPALIEVAEVWKDDVCFISAPKLGKVWQTENPMGTTPYSWAFADPTGVDDPSNMGMSICYPLYYLTPHIDSELGLMESWMQFMAPTMYTTQDASPYIRPTMETAVQDFEPGMMYNLPTGRKMGTVQPPDMGAPAIQFLNFMLGLGEKAGLPDLVSGGAVGSRLPALTLSKAYEDALSRLGPATRSGEFCIAEMLMKCRGIIGDYGEDLKVNGWEFLPGSDKTRGWATFDAKQAARGRDVSVEISTDTEQDMIGKGTHSAFMKEKRIWSQRTAMKYSGVKDIQDELDEIAADVAFEMALPLQARKALMEDPELGPVMQQMMAAEAGANAPKGGGGGGGGGKGGGRGGSRDKRPAPPGGGMQAGGRGRNPTQKRRGAGGGAVMRT